LQVVVLKMCFMKYLWSSMHCTYLLVNFSVYTCKLLLKKEVIVLPALSYVFYHAAKEDVQQEMKIDGLSCWVSVNSHHESLIVLLIKLIF